MAGWLIVVCGAESAYCGFPEVCISAYHSENYDEQADLYTRCLQEKLSAGNRAVAYNNRGLARKGLNDLAGAVADYEQALKINPNYMYAYYNRGNVREELGDFDGAVADYTKVIEMDPDYAKAYGNRGLAYYKKRISKRQ